MWWHTARCRLCRSPETLQSGWFWWLLCFWGQGWGGWGWLWPNHNFLSKLTKIKFAFVNSQKCDETHNIWGGFVLKITTFPNLWYWWFWWFWYFWPSCWFARRSLHLRLCWPEKNNQDDFGVDDNSVGDVVDDVVHLDLLQYTWKWCRTWSKWTPAFQEKSRNQSPIKEDSWWNKNCSFWEFFLKATTLS